MHSKYVRSTNYVESWKSWKSNRRFLTELLVLLDGQGGIHIFLIVWFPKLPHGLNQWNRQDRVRNDTRKSGIWSTTQNYQSLRYWCLSLINRNSRNRDFHDESFISSSIFLFVVYSKLFFTKTCFHLSILSYSAVSSLLKKLVLDIDVLSFAINMTWLRIWLVWRKYYIEWLSKTRL